jgi:hypothetical protein
MAGSPLLYDIRIHAMSERLIQKNECIEKIGFPGAIRPNQNIDWAQVQIFDRADALEAFYRDGLERIGGHGASPLLKNSAHRFICLYRFR